MICDLPLRSVLHRRRALLGIGLLILGLVAVGCDSSGGVPAKENTVAGVVSLSQNDAGAFADALKQAALTDSLSDEDTTLTVFAPVDSAFGNVDQEDLTEDHDVLNEVLTYHVVSGQALTSDQMEDGQRVETMEGDSLTLRVDDGAVEVNGASVTTADLEGTNGVVHLIDGVLLETVDAVDRVRLTPEFSIFADLVGQGELASTLRRDSLTVFAPTNQVFLKALDKNENGTVDDGETPGNAGSLVQYHVLKAVYSAADVPAAPTERATLEGSTVTLKRSDGTVTVNDATVTDPNVEVENGVLHGIDSVLLPPSP